VQHGWTRARRTILVSDFVSFLAAAVIYAVSVGDVKGFAFTLGLTTLIDVVVVFLFTRPVVTMAARRPFFASGHPWSGVDPKRLGARKTRSPLGRRASRVGTTTEAKEA
jgi:preprotein translocase subunit SecD